MTIDTLLPAPEILTKDETYFFDDGNCVLCVRDHLFKLHQSILRMHSTFFRKMFSLPQSLDKTSLNREASAQPIPCDDSPEAFRALCWALYADPLDTSTATRLSAENVQKFAHIGLLAHKYEFPALETWATNICRELPAAEVLMGFPLEDLKYLAYVVAHCEWTEVKGKLDFCIINGVRREENPSSISSASTLCAAIKIADHIGDEVLRARVYHAYLQSTNWNLHPAVRQKYRAQVQLEDMAGFSVVEPLSSLSDQQKLCLFRGLSSLQALRNRLRNIPDMEEFPATCDTSGRYGCQGGWASWWSSQVEKLDKVTAMDGPWDFLAVMIKKLTADPPTLGHRNSPTKECIPHVTARLTELKKALECDLPNYFK